MISAGNSNCRKKCNPRSARNRIAWWERVALAETQDGVWDLSRRHKKKNHRLRGHDNFSFPRGNAILNAAFKRRQFHAISNHIGRVAPYGTNEIPERSHSHWPGVLHEPASDSGGRDRAR